MRQKHAALRETLRANRSAAKSARRNGDWTSCWRLLEDSHILSQPWVIPHLQVHASMLVSGYEERDWREVSGQILRLLVGAPASAFKIYPVGNSGRARVSAIKPMPLRPDRAEALAKAGQRTE